MGIDKPDVWISSYLGMPFTVKGLYQGFGQARNSRWRDNLTTTRRNGVCYAVIPNDQPRPFRAQLGKPKSIKRMFDISAPTPPFIFRTVCSAANHGKH